MKKQGIIFVGVCMFCFGNTIAYPQNSSTAVIPVSFCVDRLRNEKTTQSLQNRIDKPDLFSEFFGSVETCKITESTKNNTADQNIPGISFSGTSALSCSEKEHDILFYDSKNITRADEKQNLEKIYNLLRYTITDK